MNCILKNATVFYKDSFSFMDVIIKDGLIDAVLPNVSYGSTDNVIDCKGYYIFPGFADVHVHLREPGFSYKETIKTGTMAAAHGGYTTVCCMPNLNPVPDSREHLDILLDLIKKDAVIRVLPYGSITKDEQGGALSDMEELAKDVIAFSDDGRGVQSDEMMLAAMRKAKSLGKMIIAHCEVNSLLNGGYINDGEYSKLHGHKGISNESEYKQIQRDIELVKKTGCAYHVCHISTKQSVELIRKAKADGVDITCETAPHYLILTENDLQEDGRFKMNPPLRKEEDRLALIEGIKDGTIDMIATDHAPHSQEEKSKGLAGSAMGITGIETSFPMLYTKLVKTGIISLEKLIYLMQKNPAKRFNLGNSVEVGQEANLTVFDLDSKYRLCSENFLSLGKSTPFENEEVFGECKITFMKGRIVWQKNLTEKL